VEIEILIDADGNVTRARVIQSIPALDQAALQTVYRWRFTPAIKNGHPVATIARTPVMFRLWYDKHAEVNGVRLHYVEDMRGYNLSSQPSADQYVKNLRVERIPDGSHWVIHEQPKLVIQYMRDFLKH
jgi:TonB family protein